MSAKRENLAMVGVATVACAACCAGPILGLLAAIGLGTATGFAWFGSAALVIGAAAILLVLRRRRGRECGTTPEPVPVAVAITRSHR